MKKDNDIDGFNSIGATNIIIDGPGDRTIRPCRPELVPILQAIKEKRARYIAEFGLPEDDPEPIVVDNDTPPRQAS